MSSTSSVVVVRQFVLVYDQREGHLLSIEDFADSEAGMNRRYELERKYRDESTIEVVMLGAESEEQIRRTHSRYFQTPGEILAGLDLK